MGSEAVGNMSSDKNTEGRGVDTNYGVSAAQCVARSLNNMIDDIISTV